MQPKKKHWPPEANEHAARKVNGHTDTPEQNHASNNTDTLIEQVQEEVRTARRPWYHVSHQAHLLLSIYLIALIFSGALAFWVHMHPILQIDVIITQEFQENQAPWLQVLMLAVSSLGNISWLFVLLIALAAIVLWLLHFRLEALTFVVIDATSSLLNVGIKLLVDRPRPAVPLVEVVQHAAGNSFPSGHVMMYVAYWGLLFTFTIMLFRGWRWWRVGLLILSGLFVVLVGPSRIYLGDHWASDVLGGYVIEGLWLWLCLWVYVKLRERGVLAEAKNVTG